jgi:dipeptidase E
MFRSRSAGRASSDSSALELADGWGVDDGAALVFADGALTEIIASRPHARAYRVERQGSGASERQLDTRYLG